MLDERTPSLPSATSGIASLVPQLFYDVISRLIPGSFLLLLYTTILLGPRCTVDVTKHLYEAGGLKNATITFLFLLILSVLSYAFSILLWQQWPFLKRLIYPTGEEENTQPKKNSQHCQEFNTIEKVRSFKYDFVKHRDPLAGSRITKLSAEIHMAETLAVGLAYAALVAVFCTLTLDSQAIRPDKTRGLLVIGCLVGVFGSIRARKYFCSRADYAVKNYYEIHNGPEKLKDGTKMYNQDSNKHNPCVSESNRIQNV